MKAARALVVVVLALVGARATGVVASANANDAKDISREANGGEFDSTLSALFAWSIENSNGEALRSMAEASARDALPRAGTTTNENGKYTHEELMKKRAEIREVLDAIAAQPSEGEVAKTCGTILRSSEETTERKVAALDALYDIGSQIDMANDFAKMGVLDALLEAISSEDEAIVLGACRALASASSNNASVQTAMDERGGFDALMGLASSAKASNEVRYSALGVLGMSVRTHEASRAKFFSRNGVGALRDFMSVESGAKIRARALTLLVDVLAIENAAAVLVFPRDANEEQRAAVRGLARVLVETAASVESSADVVAMCVSAVSAALDAESSDALAQIARDVPTLAKVLERIDGFIADDGERDGFEWESRLQRARESAASALAKALAARRDEL